MVDPGLRFPQDYADARERFRRTAQHARFELEALPVSGVGPDGEALTIDIALGGARDADAALLLSSGLHGVEGFLGSTLQTALLERWGERHPPLPVRLVLIHALNPYGFAWLRRVDRDNVDLNRNFLLTGERFEGAPAAYPPRDPLLNPPRPAGLGDLFPLRALASIARHGMAAMQQAVAEGQYEFPRGIFYGGAGPAALQRPLAEGLERWLGAAGRILHLDFHTGLGRWADYRLLFDEPLPEADGRPLERLCGAPRLGFAGPGGGYRSRGTIGPWCRAQLADRDYRHFCAEFGTYGPLRVLAGLRAENAAHHHAAPDSARYRAAKRRLRELFWPASLRWRRSTAARGEQLIERALELVTDPAVALNPAPGACDRRGRDRDRGRSGRGPAASAR